jgi:hypothetical protein
VEVRIGFVQDFIAATSHWFSFKITENRLAILPFRLGLSKFFDSFRSISLQTPVFLGHLVPKLQFGNAYDQAPLGVLAWSRHQAELEGRHSQAELGNEKQWLKINGLFYQNRLDFEQSIYAA